MLRRQYSLDLHVYYRGIPDLVVGALGLLLCPLCGPNVLWDRVYLEMQLADASHPGS